MPVRPDAPPNTFRVPPASYAGAQGVRPTTLLTYVPAANTQNPITADGVTVGVTPITGDNVAFESYRDVLVECRGPDDVPFYSSAVGFGIRVSLKNDTGHIITTERSAFQIEDGEGNAWPLIQGDWRDWVPLVISKVRERYAAYRTALGSWQEEVRRAMTSYQWVTPTYAADYDRFKTEYDSCMGNIVDGHDEAKCGSQADAAALSPTALANTYRTSAEAQLRAFTDRATAKITELENACATGVEERALRPDLRLITEGTFERLRILPGQTLTGYVPLNPNFGAEGPAVVHLRLYDLVTATDAAGNPTRRTHFDFRLEQAAQRP